MKVQPTDSERARTSVPRIVLEAATELFQAVRPIQVAIELLLIAAVIWVLLGYLLRTRAAAVVIPISILCCFWW